MNEELNELVDKKLDKIFADYSQTKDLNDLHEELAADLLAAAKDNLIEDVTPKEAVDQAFEDFGDIDEVIDSVLNENNSKESDHYHKTLHEHNFDVDTNGVRLDDGKLLNIDEDGITVNGGKTIRINDEGIKVGNMTIDENGVSFGKKSKHSTHKFHAQFNKDNYDTEVNVESLPLIDESEFEFAGLQNIIISYKSASLKVLATDGDKIKIREYMSRSNPNYQVKTDLNGDTLKITQGDVPRFLSLKLKVQILIPKQFSGLLDVYNHSGKIQVRDLNNLQQGIVKTQSGIIYGNNLKGNEITASAGSGNVTLENICSNDQLVIKTNSGVVNLDSINSVKYQIEAKSGTIKALDLSGAGVIGAKSGTIKIIYKKVTGDITVDSGSGTIKLEMPKEDSYTFDLEATSGVVKMKRNAQLKHDIFNLKEGQVGNNPQYNLKARAKSGTIKVE
ncbi:DUF4097 family beta strand repeat-containing protein [Companilactobacillus alimentarius]|nr:DUF4097 family beta strand repeat-containing protein [Companilactobacillus alimentarius]MDT6951714.1 DUF4097 family beta strand repeat-containing protein [Companilactobacillus alimentarius]